MLQLHLQLELKCIFEGPVCSIDAQHQWASLGSVHRHTSLDQLWMHEDGLLVVALMTAVQLNSEQHQAFSPQHH